MIEINKQAFKQAEKELLVQKVSRVKGYILETLQKIESKKKDKQRIEEELRILNLDLEDLRNGRFEKIEERISKSPIARQISIPRIESLLDKWGSDFPNFWINNTTGTYPIGNKIIYF